MLRSIAKPKASYLLKKPMTSTVVDVVVDVEPEKLSVKPFSCETCSFYETKNDEFNQQIQRLENNILILQQQYTSLDKLYQLAKRKMTELDCD